MVVSSWRPGVGARGLARLNVSCHGHLPTSSTLRFTVRQRWLAAPRADLTFPAHPDAHEQRTLWLSARAGPWTEKHLDFALLEGSTSHLQPRAIRSEGEKTLPFKGREDDKDEDRLSSSEPVTPSH